MWGVTMRGQAVVMRPIVEAELRLLLGWRADPQVVRLLSSGYRAQAPSEVKQWWEQAGTASDAFHWGLEWDGRLVGHTEINHIDWTARSGWTAILIGDRSVWRHGIGTEAVALRTEYAFWKLNLHKLSSAYFAGNLGIAKALGRAGYREVARLKEQLYRDGRWFDQILTEVLREDWEREHALAPL